MSACRKEVIEREGASGNQRETGGRKNDFCYATEGELVMFGFDCTGEAVDGRCGCRRSMSGMVSLKGTTTFKVVDKPDMTPDTLRAAVRESLEKGGWAELCKEALITGSAQEMAEGVIRLAARFDTGTVLERRGAHIRVRR